MSTTHTPLGRGAHAWLNTFSRTHQTGLDTKTSFASNTSGDGGQATSTAGYARCASNEKNPKVPSTLVAATGYVPSSRCRISALLARSRQRSCLKGRDWWAVDMAYSAYSTPCQPLRRMVEPAVAISLSDRVGHCAAQAAPQSKPGWRQHFEEVVEPA